MIKTFIKTPAFITSGISYKEKKKFSLIPVALYDNLLFKKINERKIKIIRESGYKIPTNDLNPIYKTVLLLQNLKPNKLGTEIRIKKNIPSFSGLNSGISNAAGALISLNKLWGFNLSKQNIIKIGSQIDPKMAQILNFYYKPSRYKIKNAILVRPKYIKIEKDWLDNKLKKTKKTSQNPYEQLIYKYFPDIKEIAGFLRKNGCDISGVSEKGPIIYGLSEKSLDNKKIKNSLIEKIDFIWIGKSCNKLG